MHLNASHNGNSVYTVRTKVLFRRQSWGENKQTNMQFSVKGGKLAKPRRLHLYLQPVKAAGPLPLTRTLPRPCCWNKAPTVCVCSGESAWENAGPPPPWLRLGPLGRAEVFFSDGMVGGWAFVGGAEWMTDGVCVGTMPPARLSTCEKGQCAANLQCRFVFLQAHFGKRRINGWHKAGLRWWQMSFSFWFLTPFFFFANLDLLLLEKKNPPPLLCASVTTRARLLDCHIRFQGGKKRKQSSELPFTSGAVIVIHIEVVWNTPG